MAQHFLDQPRLQKTDPEWDRLVRASMKDRKYFEDSADQPSHNSRWATHTGIARLINIGLKIHLTSDPNFVEWCLDPAALAQRTNGPRSLSEWFMAVGGDGSLEAALKAEVAEQKKRKDYGGDIRPRNRVVVPRCLGLRYGSLMQQLVSQPKQKAKALFIAFFGIRNPVSCRHCVFRAGNHGCEHEPDGRRKSRSEKAAKRVFKPDPYPFDECVSIRGRWSDCCANCFWSVQAVLCDYQIAVTTSGQEVSLASRSRRESGAGWRAMDPKTFNGPNPPRRQPRRHENLKRLGVRPSGDPPAVDY